MSASDKPGVKTSELWVAVLTAAVGTVPAVFAALSGHPWVAAALGAIATAGPVVYILGRALLKAERAKSIDLLSDDYEVFLATILTVIEAVAKAAQDTVPAKKEQDAAK